MYQVASCRVDDASFGVTGDTDAVCVQDSRDLNVPEALKYNNRCMDDLAELDLYRKRLYRRWRTSNFDKYLDEIDRTAPRRRELSTRLSLSSDYLMACVISVGKVVPDERPYDTFNLRRWCHLNNFTKRHGTSANCRENVAMYHAEVSRRRHHARKHGDNCGVRKQEKVDPLIPLYLGGKEAKERRKRELKKEEEACDGGSQGIEECVWDDLLLGDSTLSNLDMNPWQ